MKSFLKAALVALVLVTGPSILAQSPNEPSKPLLSPSVPAGPRPTATITPLETSPEPTMAVTPLPSASPAGTQPQTTNTVAPTPTPTPRP